MGFEDAPRAKWNKNCIIKMRKKRINIYGSLMWNKRAYFAEKQLCFRDDLLRTHSAPEFFASNQRGEPNAPHAASSSSVFRHLLRCVEIHRFMFCSRRGSHLTLLGRKMKFGCARTSSSFPQTHLWCCNFSHNKNVYCACKCTHTFYVEKWYWIDIKIV